MSDDDQDIVNNVVLKEQGLKCRDIKLLRSPKRETGRPCLVDDGNGIGISIFFGWALNEGEWWHW